MFATGMRVHRGEQTRTELPLFVCSTASTPTGAVPQTLIPLSVFWDLRGLLRLHTMLCMTRDIYTHREEKDALFAGSNSPLTPEQRSIFTGLDYFRNDSRYIVRAQVTIFEAQKIVTLETSKGNTQHFYRHGWAKMELLGKRECLTLYVPSDQPNSPQFFVPFLDSTNGSLTYSHGRYLDLVRDEDGLITIDFNFAYNPYCAYSSRWDCVMPPIENTIEQPVRAGERLFA
jgi:uncharacterized protein (DUF1684 family)